MKNISLLIFMGFLIGCGGSPSESVENETPNPENTDIPGDTGTEQTPSPGTDPNLNQSYTHTYANNFCDSQSSGLECWGDVTFTETPVVKLAIGRDMICVSHTWPLSGAPSILINRDITCYAHNEGPIQMSADKILGLQNGHTKTFMNMTVNSIGQICIRSAEWNGNTITTTNYPCGYTMTNEGGLQ